MSTLIPVTEPVAQFPAGSQDLPEVMVWFAPSADTLSVPVSSVFRTREPGRRWSR